MINDINYAGKSFRQDLGLYVDTIESYGTPKKSYTFHEVLGRNGSLAVDDHRFEAHEETFNCYIRKDFLPNFRAVQAFFNSLKGYQRLERTNSPDLFEMGLYEGGISPTPTQLLKAGVFPFRLRLRPEKWLKSGEITVDMTEASELENPTLFESKPLIRIYGTGTVNINNDYITIDSASPFTFIDLDCETMNASSAGNNANQYIEILNDAEITLKPGTNYVTYSGSITKIEITPRWYTI